MTYYCLNLVLTLYGSGYESLSIGDIGPFKTENDRSAWIKRFWEGLDLLKTQIEPRFSDEMTTQLIPNMVPSFLSEREVPPTIWEVLDEIETYCQRSLSGRLRGFSGSRQ